MSVRPLSLGDILSEAEDYGTVLLSGLLVLPFLFPMPPGLTTILGSGCLILSFQIAFFQGRPWLPKRIARYQFPHRLTTRLLGNLHRFTMVIEKRTRPRWLHVARHPLAHRLNGLCMVWLTLLLMSPVPFTNPIPTIGILLFVVAMLENDGVLMCVAYAATGLITACIGAIAYLVLQSPEWLSHIWT